jgi:hypothetical protein
VKNSNLYKERKNIREGAIRVKKILWFFLFFIDRIMLKIILVLIYWVIYILWIGEINDINTVSDRNGELGILVKE